MDLHELALAAAIAGADAIRSTAAGRPVDKGGIDDVVTAADFASERAVLAVIRSARPGDRIIAEESGEHAGAGGVCWHVDPLDGTSNFVNGSSDYTVSIAAEVDGVMTAAVIYRPADAGYLATARSGLTGTLKPVLAVAKPLREASITVSRPHDPQRHTLALRERLLAGVGAERRTGSASIALLRVACGLLDAYVSVDLPSWDTAAGHLLVRKAGGTVVTLPLPSGTPVSIAGTPTAAEELRRLVAA